MLEAPPTTTVTNPVPALLGTGTLILVLFQLDGVPGIPLNSTLLLPWVAPKFAPEIVTAVPGEPDNGEIVFMLGATVNVTWLLTYPFTVTTTGPLESPAGTAVAIEVSVQLPGVAVTPLNVMVLVPCELPKLYPRIFTEEPIGPKEGEIRIIEGMIVNVTVLLATPTTVTLKGPGCAPAGTAAMMLEHIGQREPARRLEESVRRTLQAGRGLTRDLGGDGNTATLTEQLIANLQ